MISYLVLSGLLNDFPYDPIETHSLVSQTTDMVVAIVFVPATLFPVLTGILSAMRSRHTAACISGIVSIALLVVQLFYYSLTTAHYG